MRDMYHADMTEEECRKVLEAGARAGYYRSCIATSRIQIGKVTNDECVIEDSYLLDTTWNP